MSAAGHQVLSFVTSGRMTKNTATATVTRFSPALGEFTEAKDIGCITEFVMPVFAATAYGRDCPDGYDLITNNYQ